MADSDWANLNNELTPAEVGKDTTASLTPPNGGGTHVYAFNSLDGTVTGAAGKYCLLANFAPTASGSWIAAALKRLSSASLTGFSPLLYIQATGNDVSDNAYLLGLENADPYRIVLRKGTIIGGIPQANDGEYLRRSSQQYQISDDLWHHIAVEAVRQPNGEVYLNCWENDLSVNPVTAPVWAAIDGMTQFIDDVPGINSGSAPYGGGYCGFAFSVAEAVAVRAAFDHIQIRRQV
jgi:hypothetical protein